MDEKTLKRDLRDAWAELRRLRRARAKMTSADELGESANLVTAFGAQLTTLSARARALEGAPLPDVTPAGKVERRPAGLGADWADRAAALGAAGAGTDCTFCA